MTVRRMAWFLAVVWAFLFVLLYEFGGAFVWLVLTWLLCVLSAVIFVVPRLWRRD